MLAKYHYKEIKSCGICTQVIKCMNRYCFGMDTHIVTHVHIYQEFICCITGNFQKFYYKSFENSRKYTLETTKYHNAGFFCLIVIFVLRLYDKHVNLYYINTLNVINNKKMFLCKRYSNSNVPNALSHCHMARPSSVPSFITCSRSTWLLHLPRKRIWPHKIKHCCCPGGFIRVTGFEKTRLHTHNYKYLEIPILIIWRVISWEGKKMLACNMPRFYSYS